MVTAENFIHDLVLAHSLDVHARINDAHIGIGSSHIYSSTVQSPSPIVAGYKTSRDELLVEIGQLTPKGGSYRRAKSTELICQRKACNPRRPGGTPQSRALRPI